MQSVTRRGMNHEPARYSDPGPVFPLTRKPPVGVPVRHSSARGASQRDSLPAVTHWPFDSEPESGIYEIVDEEPLPMPLTARQIAVRILGFLVLAAALFGCGTLLFNAKVAREVLGWVTFGHADQVLDVART